MKFSNGVRIILYIFLSLLVTIQLNSTESQYLHQTFNGHRIHVNLFAKDVTYRFKLLKPRCAYSENNFKIYNFFQLLHLIQYIYMYIKATQFQCLTVMFGHSFGINLNIMIYHVTLRASAVGITHFVHYCQFLHSIDLSRPKTSFVSSDIFYPHPYWKLTK